MQGTVSAQAPRIVVFGQFKMGTTALFYAIRKFLPDDTIELFEATGYAPKTADAGRAILAKVVPSESEAGEPTYAPFLEFSRKLMLVRDPRDWFLSAVMFRPQSLEIHWGNDDRVKAMIDWLRAKERDPGGYPILDFLQMMLTWESESMRESLAWVERSFDWLLRFEGLLEDYHRVRYEDFVDGRLDETSAYLGLGNLRPVEVDRQHDHVIRTGTHGLWRQWLTASDVAELRPVMESYRRAYDYPADWVVDAAGEIPPQICSRYVLNTVNRKRVKNGLAEIAC